MPRANPLEMTGRTTGGDGQGRVERERMGGQGGGGRGNEGGDPGGHPHPPSVGRPPWAQRTVEWLDGAPISLVYFWCHPQSPTVYI